MGDPQSLDVPRPAHWYVCKIPVSSLRMTAKVKSRTPSVPISSPPMKEKDTEKKILEGNINRVVVAG